MTQTVKSNSQSVKEWAEEWIKTGKFDKALLSELECAFGGNIPDDPIELIRAVIKESIVAAAEYWGKRAFEAGRKLNGGNVTISYEHPSFDDWWRSVSEEVKE